MNRFDIGPLHYLSGRSDIGREFSEIFVIENRLPDSPSRGVDKIAFSYNFFQKNSQSCVPCKLGPPSSVFLIFISSVLFSVY